MRTAFDTTVRFDHTIADVWSALTDWDRLGQWIPGVVSATGPTDPSIGDELTLRMQRGHRVSILTAWQPEVVMSFRSTTGPVTAEYRYELSPTGPTCPDTRLIGRCDVRGPMRLVAPLIRRTLRTSDGDQLTRLRGMTDGERES